MIASCGGSKMPLNENLGTIFRTLDISEHNGLAINERQDMTIYQRYFYRHAKEKLGIDAIYFLRDTEGNPKIPLVYFSAMDTYDSDKIAELHRLSWNMGEAPLLFVVLPDKLLIYNNYAAPERKEDKLNPNKGLIETISLIKHLETERRLLSYHRIELETGEYWRKNNNRFSVKNRIDISLIDNLKVMRNTLIKTINSASIVHSLLGRSILIKYLEERSDSHGNSAFPPEFYSAYLPNATKYTDVLTSKKATYNLFSFLEKKFHGDMFRLIENEMDVVIEDDLLMIRDFLSGEIDLKNSQLSIWPLYSFNTIPIQLISSIYEMFFHLEVIDEEDKEEKGTYYTPYHLVEMLMDEVLPWEGPSKTLKILDPACGSGVFLVEAYRRIVGKWMHNNNKTSIDDRQLIKLMQDSIFGVDSNEEAIRVASFSLCLTMCDYLEPRSIWDKLVFPELKNNNLFPYDFFSVNNKFADNKYDIIIGNPPWESQLSVDALKYIKDTGHPIGDKQIAQAFSWLAAELCACDGDVCLLMPSKGFLFNRSKTNISYRKAFFDTYDVSVIINYSAFRKVLFDHATGPAVGVLFKPEKPRDSTPIYYCTPKPIYTIEDRRRFVIEPIDICRIPRDIIYDDLIWKIAMWGGPRDLDLINKICDSHISLGSLVDSEGLSIAEGYKSGNKKKKCTDFRGKPVIFAKDMKPFYFQQMDLSIQEQTQFECTVEKNRRIFTAPHLLIKQSPKKWRFIASVLDYDAVFNHSILGLHGEEGMLKYLCLLINSKLFSYYQLMTSRRWLVERDELEAGEIKSFPVPIPSESTITKARELFKSASSSEGEIYSEIDTFVYDLYHLMSYEIKIVEDSIDYIFDYFNAKGKSNALTLPKEDDLESYAKVICDVLRTSLDRNSKFTPKIYTSRAPLAVAKINLLENCEDHMLSFNDDSNVESLLTDLDSLLFEQRSESVYVKRNVRVYNRNEVYIIKPNQKRYWTYSAACRDADEIFADIMNGWRKENE